MGCDGAHVCRLESDIAVLEQHLETMRATYQLNAEKLEYNYRVLLERDAGLASHQCCCLMLLEHRAHSLESSACTQHPA